MCGRYRIKDTAAVDDLTRQLFGIPLWANGPVPPRYNIAPSQVLPALTRTAAGKVEPVTVRWGFESGWSPAGAAPLRPINAQAETVATKAMFRDATRLALVDFGLAKQEGEKSITASTGPGGCGAFAHARHARGRGRPEVARCCCPRPIHSGHPRRAPRRGRR